MKFCGLKLVMLMAALMTLNACGSKDRDADEAEVKEVKDQAYDKFNLAKFVRESPRTDKLKKAVSPGDAFLFFGEANKFRAETNLGVESKGDKGFFGGARAVSSSYWLDGKVFGQRVGPGGRGTILDLGSVADLSTTSLEVNVRFLGQDKYKGKIQTAFDQTFARDLHLETVFYPVPLLGISVGGNIGGEVGLRAELGVRDDNMLSVVFKPKTSISAGLGGGVKVLAFATAKIEGMVKLLELSVAATANLGFMPDTRFAYGHIGVDGGELNAIDGKIQLVASAGLNGILPSGIDNRLWNYILDKSGIDAKIWEWEHTVWNPEPLYERDIPTYGTSFANLGREPGSLAACRDTIGTIDRRLSEHMEKLMAYSSKLEGVEAQMAEASLYHLSDIRAKNSEYCRKF